MFYQKCKQWELKLLPLFLLVIRLYWGIALLIAGFGKLIHLDQTIQSFETIGLAWPTFFALLIGLVELIGGLSLILGLWVRLALIPVAIMMLVAYPTAHKDAASQFFTNQATFMTEIPTTFLLVALFVLLVGAGRYSLDYYYVEKGSRI
jgi:putative oxidoreductase